MAVKKQSVSIAGHRTSFSLEEEFLAELRNMAERRAIPFSRLIVEIDALRPPETNLSSALRLAVLRDCKARHEQG